MKTWKIWFCILCTVLMLSVSAAAEENFPEIPQGRPEFQNPDGMTVEFIYYYETPEGDEIQIGRVPRVIIPAGVNAVPVSLQEKLLPEGMILYNPADIPLTEDTMEVKIQVLGPAAEKPQKPGDRPLETIDPSEETTESTEETGDSSEETTEPTEETGGPSEETTEPTEEPAGPSEETAAPTEESTSPDEETEKPTEETPESENQQEKPQNKPGREDPTNPKTGDDSLIWFWLFLTLGTSAFFALFFIQKKRD